MTGAFSADRGLFNEVHQNANNLSIFGSKFGCLACVRAAHQESVLVLGVTNVATQEVTLVFVFLEKGFIASHNII